MTVLDDRALFNMIGDRPAPSNVEAEQALIGAILVNNDAYRLVADTVRAEHFHEAVHQRLWGSIATTIEGGGLADRITIAGEMKGVDLGGVDAPAYIARLCAEASAFANVQHYAEKVRDKAICREIIDLTGKVQSLAYNLPPDTTAEKLFGEVDRMLDAKRPMVRGSGDFLDFRAAAAEAVYRTAAAYKRPGQLVGLSTGLPRLDDALGGLHPGNLIIVGGRSGMGKTGIATTIAYSGAQEIQRRRAEGETLGIVGFFSLEMPAAELANRIMSARSEVASFRLRKGAATQEEMDRYMAAERELAGLPLLIDQTSGIAIGALRMKARALKKRRGLELLIVDYLQLITGTPRRDGNRVQEVTEVSTGLKALAKELDVPIIALAQLSREVEKRLDRRPMMSDLRESGSIEQDADVVLLAYREEYYLRREEPRKGTRDHETWQRRLHMATGVADIIIAKNRHGPEGVTLRLGFEGAYTRFTNEPEYREPMPEPEKPREARERQPKGPSLNALGALGRLLAENKGIENDGSITGAPKKTKVIPYDTWATVCTGSLLDPAATDAQRANFMKGVVNDLMTCLLIVRGGDGFAYVWLTERGTRALKKVLEG